MLNDTVFDARLNADDADDRRGDPRIPIVGELVMFWLNHRDMPMRYRLMDRSEHGYRIYSTLPVPTGTTGMITRILPDGECDDPVAVAWFRRSSEGGYELGLRRLQP